MNQKSSLSPALFLGLCLFPLAGIFFPRSLAFLPALVGLAGVLWFVFKDRQSFVFSKPYLLVVSVIGALWLVSCLWSVDGWGSFEKVYETFPVLLFGGLLVSLCLCVPLEKAERFLWVFPVCLGLASAFIALELYFDMPVYRLTRERGAEETISTAVMNRGIVTIILSSFAGLFFLKVWSGAKIYKMVIAVFYGLSVGVMLSLTQSQSAQLALILGFLFFYFFPYRSRLAYPALVSLFILLLFSSPWIAHFLWDQFAFNLQKYEFLREGYASNRIEIWDFVSTRALQSPWYGHGLEATKLIGDFDHVPIFQDSASILHPHNFALQIWIEFGVLGVVLFSFFSIYLFSSIRDCTDGTSRRVCLTTLVAVLGVAAVGYGMWQSWWLGLLIYLVCLCILAVRFERSFKKNTCQNDFSSV